MSCIWGGGAPQRFVNTRNNAATAFDQLSQRVRAGHCLFIGACVGSNIVCGQYARVGPDASIAGFGFVDVHIVLESTDDGSGPRPVRNKVQMQPQIGVVARGNQRATFIATKTGVWKHVGAARILQSQL